MNEILNFDAHKLARLIRQRELSAVLDKQGEPREMANHGFSNGYRIHRVVVNRWELERHQGKWKIRSRTLLPVDGTEAPRQLLTRGLSDVLHGSN